MVCRKFKELLMKTLLSKIKLEALSAEQMEKITGGEDCKPVDCMTYYSNDAEPTTDQCEECS